MKPCFDRVPTSAPFLMSGLRHADVVLRHRAHERRLAAERLDRLHVGAVRQEQPDELHVPGLGGGHQRGFADGAGQVRVGAGLQQCVRERRAAVQRRLHERGDALVRRRVHVRAGLQQQRRGLAVVPVGGPVQRRGPIALGLVHVGALLEQDPHGGGILLLDRVRQPGVAVGRGEAGKREQRDPAELFQWR